MMGPPDGHQANGVFIAVGTSGFTALALVNLGDHARKMHSARLSKNIAAPIISAYLNTASPLR